MGGGTDVGLSAAAVDGSVDVPAADHVGLVANQGRRFVAEFVDAVYLLYLFVAALLYACHVMGDE